MTFLRIISAEQGHAGEERTLILFFFKQTKELLADLQDLLPNTEDAGGANLTMNTVLQCAIDFLTQHAGKSAMCK